MEPPTIRPSCAVPQRIAAIEDAGRLRDALGAALPTGIPVAFLSWYVGVYLFTQVYAGLDIGGTAIKYALVDPVRGHAVPVAEPVISIPIASRSIGHGGAPAIAAASRTSAMPENRRPSSPVPTSQGRKASASARSPAFSP